MFKNIFLKTLRDNLAGILIWGTGLGLIMLAAAAIYPQVVQGTGAERVKNLEEMTKAFQAFSFMIGEVTSLGTIGGFITTRYMGLIPTLLSLWLIIVAVGLIRGEEQVGALDVLLSTPRSRAVVLTQKVLVLLVMLVAAVTLTGLGLLAGAASVNEPIDTGGLSLAMLNVAALAGFWAAVGLLAGQFTETRRIASATVGGLVFASFLMDNVLSNVSSLNWVAWLLPTHYYAVSKPLVPGRSMDWGAWAVLVFFAALCVALTGLIFSRRDIGHAFAPFRREGRAQATPRSSSSTLLGSPFQKAVRDLIGPTIAWGIGLGMYGVIIMGTANEMLEPMRQMAQGMGWLARLLGDLTSTEAYLSVAMFTYLPVILTAYSIMQVEGWASDEEEGRLEVLAAMPLPRWQILFARYMAIAAGLAVVLVFIGGFTLLAAAVWNVNLDAGRLIAALAAALPLALLVAAFGLAVATWLPRPGGALGITIALVVVMFFLEILVPIFDLPEWVRNLSIFHLYGRPLVEGIQWGALSALIAGALVFGAASLVGLQRRDIAK